MVDAAFCNKIPMVLLAGVGFEAGMVNNANRELKNRLGALAYIMSGAQQFFTQEDFKATVDIEGQVLGVQNGGSHRGQCCSADLGDGSRIWRGHS